MSAVMWMVLQARRIGELRGLLSRRDALCGQLQQDLAAARQECATAGAELEASRQLAAEKLALLQTAETKLRDAFSALSSEALRHNNEAFLQLARTSLGEFQRAA